MSYTITNECVSCGRCQVVCPTGAIELDGNKYQINSSLCHDCFGYHRVPQCVAICSTLSDCIIEDRQDYWKKWFLRYYRLVSQLHPKPRRSKSLTATTYNLFSTNF